MTFFTAGWAAVTYVPHTPTSLPRPEPADVELEEGPVSEDVLHNVPAGPEGEYVYLT